MTKKHNDQTRARFSFADVEAVLHASTLGAFQRADLAADFASFAQARDLDARDAAAMADAAADTRWQITSAAGVDLGVYDGATEAAALDALARDAGYRDQVHAEGVAGKFDGVVEAAAVEIIPPTQAWIKESNERAARAREAAALAELDAAGFVVSHVATKAPAPHGCLCAADDGRPMRPATRDERRRSLGAGAEGHIEIDGRTFWVDDSKSISVDTSEGLGGVIHVWRGAEFSGAYSCAQEAVSFLVSGFVPTGFAAP